MKFADGFHRMPPQPRVKTGHLIGSFQSHDVDQNNARLPRFPLLCTDILVLHLLNYVELPPMSDRTVQKGIKYNLAGLVSRRGDMRLNEYMCNNVSLHLAWTERVHRPRSACKSRVGNFQLGSCSHPGSSM